MKQRKNIVLFLCMMCLFALTGCMKFVFNNSLSTANSNDTASSTDVINYSSDYFKTTTKIQTMENDNNSNNDYNNNDNNAISYFSEKSCLRYEQLSDTQKIVYDEIFVGIQNGAESIDISVDINEADLQKIYDAIINTADFELVYPTRKYDYKYDSITGNVYKINPKYEVSLDVRNAMIDRVEEITDSIISQTMGLDEFQTLKFFHDYIILNCSYEQNCDNYSNAYGALVDGKAVCEGYSRAFKYLCDKVGIPCELVIGSTDIDHMWNIVQIDGNWYHIDVTWDDPKNKDGDYISYSYFNLPEEQILIDHSINDTYTIPLANSLDMNFFNYYNLCAYSLEDLDSILYNQVIEACSNGTHYAYFRANDKSVYDEIMSSLCDGYSLYQTMKDASNQVGVDLDVNGVSFSYDDCMLTFALYLDY